MSQRIFGDGSTRRGPKETTRPPGGFLVMQVGYVAIIIAVFVLFFSRHRDAATLVSFGGTAVWTFGILAWIVFFDSRRRWPGASASQRLKNVITFRRD